MPRSGGSSGSSVKPVTSAFPGPPCSHFCVCRRAAAFSRPLPRWLERGNKSNSGWEPKRYGFLNPPSGMGSCWPLFFLPSKASPSLSRTRTLPRWHSSTASFCAVLTAILVASPPCGGGIHSPIRKAHPFDKGRALEPAPVQRGPRKRFSGTKESRAANSVASSASRVRWTDNR